MTRDMVRLSYSFVFRSFCVSYHLIFHKNNNTGSISGSAKACPSASGVPELIVGSCYSIFSFYASVIVCLFDPFHSAIASSVLPRFTASDYLFEIFKTSGGFLCSKIVAGSGCGSVLYLMMKLKFRSHISTF
jgi:hypothetical protein